MAERKARTEFDDMLTVTDLTKTYRDGDREVKAVREASFTAGHGEFVAIVGPSGSGKTTMLAMLGGLLTPTSGSITLNGREITGLSARQLTEYRRLSVGYVFQANNLLAFLTARENLMVMCSIGACKGNGRERADRLIEELGLTERADAVATRLSGGERQRVAIGRALMNDPEIVLVDEPTANLDSVRGRQVVEMLMRETKDRNKLAIMVTHDLCHGRPRRPHLRNARWPPRALDFVTGVVTRRCTPFTCVPARAPWRRDCNRTHRRPPTRRPRPRRKPPPHLNRAALRFAQRPRTWLRAVSGVDNSGERVGEGVSKGVAPRPDLSRYMGSPLEGMLACHGFLR